MLNGQATLALAERDDDAALDRLAEAVALAAGIDTTWTMAYALPALAAIAARRGRAELAAELFAAAAQAASVTVGLPAGLGRRPHGADRRPRGARRGGLRAAWERGRELRPGDVPGLVARITRPAHRR